MAQQRIDITLGFQADTAQAKTQIEQLQQSLSKLTATSGTVQNNGNLLGLDPKSISEANLQIAQLQTALKGAFNTKTEKLDLGLFQNSLKQAGLSVQDLSKTFASLGPQGVETFTQLSKTIASAEAPVIRLGDGIRSFMTTLANSARYMVATRALNTMAGTIMNALNYAKDLDKSLNNIAIVTGASSEKMAEFAAQANKAAQRLSVTTTGYTDAALIYYQQGLSDQEVAKRTETTMKMSNVTGESAQEVSSYMTAIWNNFYDGSQSIEEFADKITALGAATASSSQEIANGLQQFAAVANTVGLSYDYAASALATIVAQTRQSESTVGNGLRTLFSRLQGLKLEGETEDGVSLNKYSAAVEQFGIQVLDQKGELREMDDILMDMGEKWQTLSRAQQVALAQTVGGVRQYTTLVALMDNFDKFKENISIAQGAEGTLQQQQEIYERSWEASSKRVKAAAQSIYQDIIDDKFFIGLNDLFAGFLKTVDQAIKGLGGVKGVLSAISAIVFTLFKGDIAQKINNLTVSLNTLYHPESIDKTRIEFFNAYKDFLQNTGTSNVNSNYSTNALQTQISGQERLLELSKNLSKSNQEVAAAIQQQVDKTQELVIQETKELQLSDQRLTKTSSINSERIAINTAIKNNNDYYDTPLNGDISTKELEQAITFGQSYQATQGLFDKINSTMIPSQVGADFDLFKQSLEEVGQLIQKDARFSDEFKAKFLELGKVDTPEKLKQGLSELQNAIDKQFGVIVTGEGVTTNNKIFDFIMNVPAENFDKKTREWIEQLRAGLEKHGKQIGTTVDGIFADKAGQAAMNRLANQTENFGQKVSNFARNASSMAMQINGIRGAITALNDNDIAPWEKFIRVITGFGMTFGPGGIGTQLIQGIGRIRTDKVAFENSQQQTIQGLTTQLNSFKDYKKNLPIQANNAYNNTFLAHSGNALDPYITGSGVNDLNWEALHNKVGGAENFDVLWNKKDGYQNFSVEQQQLVALAKNWQQVDDASRQAAKSAIDGLKNVPAQVKTVNAAIKNTKGEIQAASAQTFDFGASLKAAFGGLATQLAVMAAITVSVMAMKRAFELFHKTTTDFQLEQLGFQVENIKESINQLNTVIGQTSEKIQSVKDLAADIERAKTAVDSLKEGTLEYNNKVRETNINIQKTLEELGLWGKIDLKVGQKGIYQFDQADVIKELEKINTAALERVTYLNARQEYLGNKRNVLSEIEKSDFELYQDSYGQWRTSSPQNFSSPGSVYSTTKTESEKDNDFYDAYKQITSAISNLDSSLQIFDIEDLSEAIKNGDADKIKDALAAAGLSDTNLANLLFSSGVEGKQLWDTLKTIDNSINKNNVSAEIANAKQKLEEQGYDTSKLTDEQLQKYGEYLVGDKNLDNSKVSEYLDKIGLKNVDTKKFIEDNEYARAYIGKDWTDSSLLQNPITKSLLGIGGDVVGEFMLGERWNEQSSAGEEVFRQLAELGAGQYSYDEQSGTLTTQDGTKITLDDFYNKEETQKVLVQNLINMIRSLSTEDLDSSQIEDIMGITNGSLKEKKEEEPKSYSDLDKTETFEKESLGLNDESFASEGVWEATKQKVQETSQEIKELVGEAADYSDDTLKLIAWDVEQISDGFSILNENSENWFKAIKKGGSSASKALEGLTDAMLKITGLQDEFSKMEVDISKEMNKYLASDEGLENAEKAAKGDMEAILEIRKKAAEYAYQKNTSSESGVLWDTSMTDSQREEMAKDLTSQFTEIYSTVQEELNNGSLVLGKTTKIDPSFYTKLDNIVSSSAKSIDDANAILASLNLESADFELIEEKKKVSSTVEVTKKNGDPVESYTYTSDVSIFHPVKKGTTAQLISQGEKGFRNGKNKQNADGSYTVGEKGWANYQKAMQTQEYKDWAAQQEINLTNPSLPAGLGYNDAGGTGSGGGGGGGGSGSGGKEREQKAYEDEIERYHYLLKTIDAVNKKYDELENAREKAYGTDEIEVMDKEIENLQQQIGLQKQYLDAISQDYLSDRAAIAAYGAQFDENGNIINYEEIYRRQIDLVNSAAGDDEAADKAYEQFKKVLEQYEKTNELLQDTKLSYQELLDKAAELNLEKITVSVEYNVAISDRDRKYLEWLADNMGDSIDKTADKIANLSKQMETYVQDAQTYGEGINAILDQVGEAGLLEKIINQDLTKEQFKELGLTTQQIKQIEDYKDKLMETQQAERELAKTAVEEVTTAFSDWNEEVSDSIDRITSLNDSLEKYRDIIGLLNEDIIGSTKALNDEIDAAERQNNLKAIEGQQRKYEQAQQNFERLNALYKDAQDKDNQVAIDALKDSVKEAEEAVIQAHQDMLEATSNALDALEKQWEASMERISKEFAKNMTGLNDISYFKDMYDRQKEMSDWYLDDYEKYYNLNKLVTQINKDLGDNSSLVVSSKLNGLLGKINGSLAEGAQISEATVGYYQKELELIEAQMALEAARNAKSVVRMVRDNEGNMSYVYTADSDAIESAEENYQEKWYNLMQYTTEQQDELQEKMISSMEDFIDRAVEAAEKFGIGTEAFNRELGNIQQDFTDLFDYLAGEMDNADGMFSHLQNNWWKELEEGLQKTVALEPDFKTTFGKTILGQLLGTEDTEDWINLMNSGTNKALSQIYDNGQTYVQNQDAVLQAANSSLESVIDDTSIGVSENQEMANEEMQKLDETLTNGEKVLGDAADSLKAFGDKWNGQMTAMTATTDALVKSLNNYFNALSKINDISSSSNPFDFSTMVPSFEQELEEMKDMPYSQLDLSEISSQLVSAPSMISDVSTSGLTALLSLVPSGELDQNVQINATFPNVVNHREIELALNNLILSASQYANRK